MFRIWVRKSLLSGEVLEEYVEELPGDSRLALADLGSILARKLMQDSQFLEFCREYRAGILAEGA